VERLLVRVAWEPHNRLGPLPHPISLHEVAQDAVLLRRPFALDQSRVEVGLESTRTLRRRPQPLLPTRFRV